ncbi:MAG: AAA family ATPase [Candidatus Obscuribacterales bacterium]|nr:AAA family ATPase [Candidatus Obscuribacterales bacterium]
MNSKKSDSNQEIQRPPAEMLYADELKMLAQEDAKQAKPEGWLLSPRSVIRFITGDKKAGLQPKFVGNRSFLERCVVALATSRGLMLIGEPGTAKSYLSELLSAAISGDSTLTIQGSGGTTEDNIRYSWNYALLLAEGPSPRSLVPAPLHRGMQKGKIVRFEEITRCPLEIQDTLLSVLSDRVLAIPELPDDERMLFAKQGFNIIATANTRDRGVNEMSAALKRRFNFETVQAIRDINEEMELVQRETTKLFKRASIPVEMPADVTQVLVTAFHELRNAKTVEGQALEGMTTVMSTAEAISTGYAAGLHAYYYSSGSPTGDHLVHSLLGTALKDNPDDIKKLRHYFNHAVRGRKGKVWQEFYEAHKHLP